MTLTLELDVESVMAV